MIHIKTKLKSSAIKLKNVENLIGKEVEITIKEVPGKKNKHKLPFLINLSASERQAIPTMDNSRKPFVEKALSYGQSFCEIVPAYVDLEELKTFFNRTRTEDSEPMEEVAKSRNIQPYN